MGLTYDDEDRERILGLASDLLERANEKGQRALARALSLIEDREQLAADIAARERWLETHYVPDRPAPEPEPKPRAAVPRRDGRRRELPAWVALQIRNEVAAALRRERRTVADAVGKVIAQERKTFRAINDGLIHRLEQLELEQRAAPDNNAAVLNLSDERRRRAGET